MPNFLWQFTQTASDNTVTGKSSNVNAITPMPKLSPAGAKQNNVSNNGSTAGNRQVNVVRDFYWTYSKPGDVSRNEVPRVILTERALKTNALVSQLKYSLGAIAGTKDKVIADLEAFGINSTNLTSLVNRVGGTIGVTDLTNRIGQAIGGIEDQATNFAQNASPTAFNYAAGLLDKVQQELGDDNPTLNDPNNRFLKPYQGLYLTEPTGWVYILPYFDNKQISQTNQFAETGSVGGAANLATGAVGFMTDTAEIISSLASPTQITYIERTKFYNYSSDGGETVDVEFPLINTGSVTYEDVVRNWQLLYLLVYQNRPGKTGFNTVEQPVIYQVEIPGVKFFPYCYVTSINIEFVGSRREMSISVPFNGSSTNNTQTSINNTVASKDIKTVIPDAYKVRITLQSMTANTKNFMNHMLFANGVIETGTATPVADLNPAKTPVSPTTPPPADVARTITSAISQGSGISDRYLSK